MGCIAILSMGESKVFFDDGPAFSEFQLNPSLDDLAHTFLEILSTPRQPHINLFSRQERPSRADGQARAFMHSNQNQR